MKSNHIAKAVGILLICTTICHFVEAAQPQRRQLAKNSRSTSMIPRQARQSYGTKGTSETRRDLREKGRWLSENTSLLAPVPPTGTILFGAAMTTIRNSSSADVTSGSTKFNSTSKTEAFGLDLIAMYGFTENIFVSGTIAYMPTSSKSEVSAPGYQTTTSSSKSQGYNEPELTVAATAMAASHVRVIGRIAGQIPVGSARSTKEGDTTTYNGLDGGGAVAPGAVVIAGLRNVKLIGSLDYKIRMERTRESDDSATSSTKQSGGNSTTLQAGIELPQVSNLGFSVAHASYAPSTSRNSSGETESEGYRSFSLTAHAGFEIPGSRVILMPWAVYGTLLDQNREGVSGYKSDTWALSLRGLMTF